MRNSLNLLLWVIVIIPWLSLGCDSATKENYEAEILLFDVEFTRSLGLEEEFTQENNPVSLPTPIITGSHKSVLAQTVVTLHATCGTSLPILYEWEVHNGQILSIYNTGGNVKVSNFYYPPILSIVKCRVKYGDLVSEWGIYTIDILRYARPIDGVCIICGATEMCDCETIIIGGR